MPKLTKRTIDATHPKPGRDVFVWDDELPAYGLRVKPSGSKAFILQYRNRNGRSRRLTLGRYGILTPDAARDLARNALAEVAKVAILPSAVLPTVTPSRWPSCVAATSMRRSAG